LTLNEKATSASCGSKPGGGAGLRRSGRDQAQAVGREIARRIHRDRQDVARRLHAQDANPGNPDAALDDEVVFGEGRGAGTPFGWPGSAWMKCTASFF